MKLIMENWKRFLREEAATDFFNIMNTVKIPMRWMPQDEKTGEHPIYEPYKNVTKENISNVVNEGKDYYILISPDHIKGYGEKRHMSVNEPGSLWNQLDPDKLSEMIVGIMNKQSPLKEGGRLKWLGVDSGVPGIGVERVKKGTSEEIEQMQDFEFKDREGNPTGTVAKVLQTPDHDKELTSAASIIAAPVMNPETQKPFIVNGKPVLSWITAFPGERGAEIADKGEFAQKGYYFVIPPVEQNK